MRQGAGCEIRAPAGVPVRAEIRGTGAVQDPNRNAALQMHRLRQGTDALDQATPRPRSTVGDGHQRCGGVPAQRLTRAIESRSRGEMAERLKAHAWKACKR